MFRKGFILQMSNPKALVFFTALVPQFLNPHAPLALQVAILAVTSMPIEFLVQLLRLIERAQKPRPSRTSTIGRHDLDQTLRGFLAPDTRKIPLDDLNKTESATISIVVQLKPVNPRAIVC